MSIHDVKRYACGVHLHWAARADTEDLDFNGFLQLLRVNSMDSLDSLEQYDSRMASSSNLQGLDSNTSGHGNQDVQYCQLQSVPE